MGHLIVVFIYIERWSLYTGLKTHGHIISGHVLMVIEVVLIKNGHLVDN